MNYGWYIYNHPYCNCKLCTNLLSFANCGATPCIHINKYHVWYRYIYIGLYSGFLKLGVPLKQPSILGIPHLWKPPYAKDRTNLCAQHPAKTKDALTAAADNVSAGTSPSGVPLTVAISQHPERCKGARKGGQGASESTGSAWQSFTSSLKLILRHIGTIKISILYICIYW
jgi:hypothetical protein